MNTRIKKVTDGLGSVRYYPQHTRCGLWWNFLELDYYCEDYKTVVRNKLDAAQDFIDAYFRHKQRRQLSKQTITTYIKYP